MNQPADKPISALEALERAQWIAFAPMVFQAACVLRDRGILAALEASRDGLSLPRPPTPRSCRSTAPASCSRPASASASSRRARAATSSPRSACSSCATR
ncbi:hypothetical protein [Nannocystis sp.]|uniref:hypothetical protein n=1 Tax=Nannocystis sp. TaxID=1962667 RepID=UPI00344F89EF